MAHAGENHRDPVLVGRRDDLGIAQRAARLNHGLDAEFGGGVQPVAERKERIRGQRRALQRQAGSSAAFIAAILLLTTRLIWPAPMPTVPGP